MIFVDSSVWIDFYNGVASATTERLRQAIPNGTVVVGDLVLTEVLQGFADERHARLAERDLTAFALVAVVDMESAVKAAANYRSLRLRGVTVRKTIDTLIATRCIIDRHPLLYADRDFDPFVRHLGLRSALDE